MKSLLNLTLNKFVETDKEKEVQFYCKTAVNND